jgi:hypothetical protein
MIYLSEVRQCRNQNPFKSFSVIRAERFHTTLPTDTNAHKMSQRRSLRINYSTSSSSSSSISSFSLAQQPNADQGRLISEVSTSQTMTHPSRQDCSGWVIGPSPRPLPDSIKRSRHTTMPQWDFVVFSSTSCFIRTCVFFMIVLHFAFLTLLTHTTQTSMLPAGIEPSTPASDRP